MKKIALLAFASAAILCASSAQAQEVQYVEDCSQGQIFNKAADNWFLTFEGGANFLVSHHDVHADFADRICGQAGIYVGKWFTPVWGARIGVKWGIQKGLTDDPNDTWAFHRFGNVRPTESGYYGQRRMVMGPEAGLQLSLTNWWCGYNPNRVYNAVLRGSAAFVWSAYRGLNKYGSGDIHWRNAHYSFMTASIGWVNNFRLSKHVEVFIEPRAELLKNPDAEGNFSLNAGVTFNLGKTDWNCPVTAVCPTWKYTDAEGDALTAKLASANNKISDLQRQLDECMKRPTNTVTAVENDCEGLVTVYYPINQASLSSREKTILRSVAAVMQNNPDQKYVLTGWADNYTGTDEINVRLRNKRVDGVKNFLVNCGVNPDQLDATIDNSNLTDYGVKSAPLDRAVTIRKK